MVSMVSGADVVVALAAVLTAAVVWLLTARGRARRRLAALARSIAAASRQPAVAASGTPRGGTARTPGPSGRVYPVPVLPVRLRSLAALRRRPVERRRRRITVQELCFALAEELRVGRTPAESLSRAVDVMPAEFRRELAGVTVAARTGGDTPAALRHADSVTGAEGLWRLAACWQVGSGSGAGFALAVQRLAGALRAEEEHRQDVSAQLAGTHATSRLLAILPVVGLLMSTAMGVQPLRFLLGTPYGLVCLVLGVAFDVAGILWTRSLARSAEKG